jgi:hypothetical protein
MFYSNSASLLLLQDFSEAGNGLLGETLDRKLEGLSLFPFLISDSSHCDLM